MRIYRVNVPVFASGSVFVEAENEQDAIKGAAEYEGMNITLCWSCSNYVDVPSYGPPEATAEAYEVDADEEGHARAWIEENA